MRPRLPKSLLDIRVEWNVTEYGWAQNVWLPSFLSASLLQRQLSPLSRWWTLLPVTFRLVFDNHVLCLVISSASSHHLEVIQIQTQTVLITLLRCESLLCACVCACVCIFASFEVSFKNLSPSSLLCFFHFHFYLYLLGVNLSIAPDNVKQCDIIEDLVTVVPGVQCSLSGVVVHHADVGVLVVEGDVGVFVRGGVSVVGKVDLCSGQMGVGDVQGAANHESLPSTPLRKPRVPAVEDFKRMRVEATHLEAERTGLAISWGKSVAAEMVKFAESSVFVVDCTWERTFIFWISKGPHSITDRLHKRWMQPVGLKREAKEP